MPALPFVWLMYLYCHTFQENAERGYFVDTALVWQNIHCTMDPGKCPFKKPDLSSGTGMALLRPYDLIRLVRSVEQTDNDEENKHYYDENKQAGILPLFFHSLCVRPGF